MMNIQKELQQLFAGETDMRFNNVDVAPETIRAIMINEVVPSCPEEDFYGKPDSAYMSTTIPLFRKAGIEVSSVQDILNNGIYITNAVKTPKTEYAVSKESIEESLPYLERELALFPNVKVIMLMGDVAKKAFNMISKKVTGKNARSRHFYIQIAQYRDFISRYSHPPLLYNDGTKHTDREI